MVRHRGAGIFSSTNEKQRIYEPQQTATNAQLTLFLSDPYWQIWDHGSRSHTPFGFESRTTQYLVCIQQWIYSFCRFRIKPYHLLEHNISSIQLNDQKASANLLFAFDFFLLSNSKTYFNTKFLLFDSMASTILCLQSTMNILFLSHLFYFGSGYYSLAELP